MGLRGQLNFSNSIIGKDFIIDDLKNKILLYSFCAYDTVDIYSSFRKSTPNLGGYTPSGSNDFLCEGIYFKISSDTRGNFLRLLYGDTAVVQSSSAPTTPIYMGENAGDSDKIAIIGISDNNHTLNIEQMWQYTPLNFVIPNGKYVTLRASSIIASAIIIGKEQV